MASLLYLSRQQVVGGDGRPVAGAKLYTYATGTSTPKSVWTDAALTVAHANPVEADANGRLPLMYVSAGDYRVSLQNPDNSVIFTDDPVPGAAGAVVNPETGWIVIESRTVASVAQADFALSASYRAFRFRLVNITSDAGNRAMSIRFSIDNGATFVATGYVRSGYNADETPAVDFPDIYATLGEVSSNVSGGSNSALGADVDISPGTASLATMYFSRWQGRDSTNWRSGWVSGAVGLGARANAVRFLTTSTGTPGGTFSGSFTLEGLR